MTDSIARLVISSIFTLAYTNILLIYYLAYVKVYSVERNRHEKEGFGSKT